MTLTPAEEGFGKEEKGALSCCIQKHSIATEIKKNRLKYVPHSIIKKKNSFADFWDLPLERLIVSECS